MASDRATRQMAMLHRLGLTETLIYRPATGTPRGIEATVDRGQPVPVMSGHALQTTICTLNDDSIGIDAATMNVGADLIDLAERIGGTPASRGIQRVVGQDEDFLTLAVI